MCGNIKTLFDYHPHVTAEEIRAASLQFVRKISGFPQTIEGKRRCAPSRGPSGGARRP